MKSSRAWELVLYPDAENFCGYEILIFLFFFLLLL